MKNKKYLFLIIIYILSSNSLLCQKVNFDNYSFVVPKEMKTRTNPRGETEFYDYNSNKDYVIFGYFNSGGNSLVTNKDLYSLLNQRPSLEQETINNFESSQTSKPEIIRVNNILIFKTVKKEKDFQVVTYYIEEKLDKIILMFQQSYNKKWDSYRDAIINSLHLLENNSLVDKLEVKLDKNPNPEFSDKNLLGKLKCESNNEVDFIKSEDSYSMNFKNNENLHAVVSIFKNQNLPNYLNSEYSKVDYQNVVKNTFIAVLDKMLSAEQNDSYEIKIKPTFKNINNINGVFAQVFKKLNKDSDTTVLQDYFFIPDKDNSYLILFFNFNKKEINNKVIDNFYKSFTLE